MTTSHQPVSPGAEDFDELDAEFALACAERDPQQALYAMERLGLKIVGAWQPISAELRTLRARVAELERENEEMRKQIATYEGAFL